MRPPPRALAGSVVSVGLTWTATSSAYLLGLTLLAALPGGNRRSAPPQGRPLLIVVLVPAHDESDGIAAAVTALRGQDYPADAFEVIVIADNCSDATAERARAAGATVWEREAAGDRGKGQALAWAIERLWRERPATDAVTVVDADCLASPGLLAAFDEAMRTGASAVQAVYDVANPTASAASALRWAGFALMHRVRPRGRARIGLSCDLFGTGMAFRSSLLRKHPWSSFSVTEDAEYHLRLVAAGEKVSFVPGERVESPMPTTHAASAAQQLRWESGNAQLLRRTVPRLAVDGVRRRDPQRLHAAIEQLVPPQTALAAANALLLALAAALRRRRAWRVGLGAMAAQSAYVLVGLRVAQAPRIVYRSLLCAPGLVASKLSVFARIGAGRGATDWIRTERGS